MPNPASFTRRNQRRPCGHLPTNRLRDLQRSAEVPARQVIRPQGGQGRKQLGLAQIRSGELQATFEVLGGLRAGGSFGRRREESTPKAQPYLAPVARRARRHPFDLGDGAGEAGAGFVEGAPAPGGVGRLLVGIRGLVKAVRVFIVEGDRVPVGIVRARHECVGHPAVQRPAHAGGRQLVRDLTEQLDDETASCRSRSARRPGRSRGRLSHHRIPTRGHIDDAAQDVAIEFTADRGRRLDDLNRVVAGPKPREQRLVKRVGHARPPRAVGLGCSRILLTTSSMYSGTPSQRPATSPRWSADSVGSRAVISRSVSRSVNGGRSKTSTRSEVSE